MKPKHETEIEEMVVSLNEDELDVQELESRLELVAMGLSICPPLCRTLWVCNSYRYWM